MPRPYIKIAIAVIVIAATNYMSYGMGYVDGIKDTVELVFELRQEIKQQMNIDPAAKRITI